MKRLESELDVDDILSERRLRWLGPLGHVIRMDHQRIPRQVPGFKRGPGHLRAQWKSTVKDGNYLGGTRGGSSKQIRMASLWPNASTWMRVESRSRSIL